MSVELAVRYCWMVLLDGIAGCQVLRDVGLQEMHARPVGERDELGV